MASYVSEDFAQEYGGGVIQSLVADMLRSGLVEEIIAFTQGLDENDVVPFSASGEEDAAKIVITSYQPYSLARLVRDYVDKDRKIGMVVRSCDARAIVELAKRDQVNINNIYMLGIECYGVAKPSLVKGALYILPNEVHTQQGAQTIDESLILSHCLRCQYPDPSMADVSCCFRNNVTSIEVHTEKGKQILASASNLSIVEGEIEGDNKVTEERAGQWQERDFSELEKMAPEVRLQYWADQLDRCIKCYGCRNACPLCYCKDCCLEASRGLISGGEIPPETLFHLTRLAHIADSCLNCGQCDAACPMEIPLSKLFHMLQKRLSPIFGYEPGMDIDAVPPLGTITERELKLGGVTLD